MILISGILTDERSGHSDSRSHSMGHRVGEDGSGNSVGNGVSDGVSNGVSNCVSNRDSLRVLGSSRVADIGDKALKVVGLVVDSLDTAVREVDRVRSLDDSSSIVGLSLVEGSSRVVISNSVVIVVRGDLSKVRGSITSGMSNSHRVGDGGGSVDQRGVGDDRGSVDNRTSNGVGHGVSDGMGHRVGNHSTGSMEPVRGVRH